MLNAHHLHLALLEHGLPPNLFLLRLGGGLGGFALVPLGKRREGIVGKVFGLGSHEIERSIRRLSWLALNHNKELTTIAAVTRATKNLKQLYLDGCVNLVTLKGSEHLKHLETLSLRDCQRLPDTELELLDQCRDHLALAVTEGCSLIRDLPPWAWLPETRSYEKRRPILEWHRHLPPYGIFDKTWNALGLYEQRVLAALGRSEASWSVGWAPGWRYWELPADYDTLTDRDRRLWAVLGLGQAQWGKWGSTGWMPCLLRAARV